MRKKERTIRIKLLTARVEFANEGNEINSQKYGDFIEVGEGEASRLVESGQAEYAEARTATRETRETAVKK